MFRVTSDIIWDNLSAKMDIKKFGPAQDVLLKRPKFISIGQPVNSGYAWIASPETLPANPNFDKDTLIICVGGQPMRSYMRGNFHCFVVPASNILETFNEVQGIFERYEQWDSQLHQVLSTEADIAAMVRLSRPILENPIIVMDEQLKCLATSHTDMPDEEMRLIGTRFLPGEPIPLEKLVPDKSVYYAKSLDKTPYFFPEDKFYYVVNLFVKGRFRGSISISRRIREFRNADFIALHHLSKMIEAAMGKYLDLIAERSTSLKAVVADLLSGNPVIEQRMQQVLRHAGTPTACGTSGCESHYRCVTLKMTSNSKTLPTEYICSTFEALLPGCVAVAYDSAIVGVVDLSVFPYPFDNMVSMLKSYLDETCLCAGISNTFEDIREVRYYFRQAICAIETGEIDDSGRRIYHFSVYMLPYIMLHCSGEFPTKYICPEGLLSLRKYDKSTSVDYWKTLRVCLDNNMNIAQTARDLYIHRSTLLQRLERIFSIVDLDITNPEQRLLLRIAIYLADMDEGTN